MFKIGDDWKVLIKRAWSLRLVELAFVFTFMEAALPSVGFAIPGGPWGQAVVTGTILACAWLSRFVVQEELG